MRCRFLLLRAQGIEFGHAPGEDRLHLHYGSLGVDNAQGTAVGALLVGPRTAIHANFVASSPAPASSTAERRD